MRVHRFIGLSEIEALLNDGVVNPLAENPYRFTEEVAKNEDLLTTAVKDAMEQLRAIKNRYSYLKQLGDIWSAIEAHDE